MVQTRGTIWTERALVVLILASLAGTLNLVMAVHRRAAAIRNATQAVPLARPAPSPTSTTPVSVAIATPPSSSEIAKPAPKTKFLDPPKPPALPLENPAQRALQELSAATVREIEAARQADRKAEALEKARQAAIAESERWQRREMLVRQQITTLAQRAEKIDRALDALAREHDVLARERDALKAALAKNQGKGSYAVLPDKGPNGTWRRPIVLECSNGTVTLRPNGPTFSMLDLSALVNPHSSPVILAIARELLHIQMSESPDGAPVVPYFVFLVRPDGIRPYYEARARLEPLGIAFGYELIEQDLKVDVPDFDNLATWDGTIPLEVPLLPAPGGEAPEPSDRGEGLAWPSARPGSDGGRGRGQGGLGGRIGEPVGPAGSGRGADSADEFVWPSRPTPRGSSGLPGSKTPGTNPGTGLAQGSFRRGLGAGDALGGQGGWGSADPSAGGRGGKNTVDPSSDGAGTGKGKAGSGPGVDPATERWPFPNQGDGELDSSQTPGDGALGGLTDSQGGLVDPGSGLDSGGRMRSGSGGAGGRPGLVPPPAGGSSGLGVGPARGQGLGLAQLLDLEPAGDGPGGSSLGPPAGRPPGLGTRSSPRPGALALAEPGGAGNGDHLTGQGSTGNGRTSPELTGSLGDPAAPESPANPPLPSSGADGTVSAAPSGSGTGSAPAGDLNSGLGLDSRAGTKGSSSLSSSAGTAGLSPGSALGGSPPAASSGSGLIFGSDSGASSGQGKGSLDGPVFKSRISDGPSKTIEVPFEIVVVCGPDGLVIHPGGYRITTQSLQAGTKDKLLVRQLLVVAQQRAATDPTIRPQPRVKFLVESGGSATFWAARKQVLFSGLNWPMSLQVTGVQNAHMLGKEAW